ncbi:MAG TPA: hypothetical protein VIE16_03765 [Phenylobacterium sp.]|jgi:hypothetical protein
MPAANFAEIVRPFLWLAAFAFLVGFVSYLALGRPAAAATQDQPYAVATSGPASNDWNLPKHI